jgi:hypothetical protein
MKEIDVLRMLLARRENYAISQVAHVKGRMYRLVMNGEYYNAVVLLSSFQFYELRYHIAETVPSLVICQDHNTVLSIPVLSMRAGNLAKAYELPEDIVNIAEQRATKTGSQVLLGQYISGVKSAQSYVNALPVTTRKRYLARAKLLGKRKKGKPVGKKEASDNLV